MQTVDTNVHCFSTAVVTIKPISDQFNYERLCGELKINAAFSLNALAIAQKKRALNREKKGKEKTM